MLSRFLMSWYCLTHWLGRLTRAVRKVSSHFQYLENRRVNAIPVADS